MHQGGSGGKSDYLVRQARAMRKARGGRTPEMFAREIGKASRERVTAELIVTVEAGQSVDWNAQVLDSMALFETASTVSGMPLSVMFNQAAWERMMDDVDELFDRVGERVVRSVLVGGTIAAASLMVVSAHPIVRAGARLAPPPPARSAAVPAPAPTEAPAAPPTTAGAAGVPRTLTPVPTPTVAPSEPPQRQPTPSPTPAISISIRPAPAATTDPAVKPDAAPTPPPLLCLLRC